MEYVIPAIIYAVIAFAVSYGAMQIQKALTPKPKNVYEGPKLDELTSSYSLSSVPIPEIYGTVRIGTNIIWMDDIREVVTRETKTKNGVKTVRVTYDYYATFAAAICRGPIAGVLKIWADDELIYTVDGGYHEIQASKSLSVTIYRGESDQPVDPTIAAKEGSDIPAFRDVAYIVFKDFHINKYGNRIPNVSVLVRA